MIRAILFGARGRMGRMVAADFQQQEDIYIVAGVEHGDHPDVNSICDGIEIIADSADIPDAEVWIDFSLADAAIIHIKMAAEIVIPMIMGVTGFSDEQDLFLNKYGKNLPLLQVPNFSIGMEVMSVIVHEATQRLDTSFEVAITEQHHHNKEDDPSGTALDLYNGIKHFSELTPQLASFRVGGAIGEHQVRFVGDHEELVITHRAFSREAFSRGVKRAVEFILEQENGIYAIYDIYNPRPD